MSNSITAKAVVSKPSLKTFLPALRSKDFDRLSKNEKLCSDAKLMHDEAKSRNLSEFVDNVLVVFDNSSNQFLGLLTKRMADEIQKGTFDNLEVRKVFLDLIAKNPDAIDTLPKVVGRLLRSGVPISSIGAVASRSIRRSNTLCPNDISQNLATDLSRGVYADLVDGASSAQISQSLCSEIFGVISSQVPSSISVSTMSQNPRTYSPISEGIITLPIPANQVSLDSTPQVAPSTFVSIAVIYMRASDLLPSQKPTIYLAESGMTPCRSVRPVEVVQVAQKKSDSLLILQSPVIKPSSPSAVSIVCASLAGPSGVALSPVPASPIPHTLNPKIFPIRSARAKKHIAPVHNLASGFNHNKTSVSPRSIKSPTLASSKKRTDSSKVSLVPTLQSNFSSRKPSKSKLLPLESTAKTDKKPPKKIKSPDQPISKSKKVQITSKLEKPKASTKKSSLNLNISNSKSVSPSSLRKPSKNKISNQKKKNPIKTPPSPSNLLPTISLQKKKTPKSSAKKKKKKTIDLDLERQKTLKRKKAKRKIILSLLLSKKKKRKSPKTRV